MVEKIKRFSHHVQVSSGDGNHLQNPEIKVDVGCSLKCVAAVSGGPRRKGEDVLPITVHPCDGVGAESACNADNGGKLHAGERLHQGAWMRVPCGICPVAKIRADEP